MFRKSFVLMLAAIAVTVTMIIPAAAQYAPASGRVEKVNPDGTRSPVTDALIEVYRTDVKTGFPSNKTNKKGEFSFAGLMFGATYVLSVSAPGCAPAIYPNVKAQNDKILVVMQPGDGNKWTEDEVRQALISGTKQTGGDAGAQPEMSAEDKKKQAEYEAKKKEVEERNAKAKNAYEAVAAALKAGNEAFAAKNYDVAIAQYTSGIDADPDFAGSAPVLLNNRGIALMNRAVETFNKNVKNPDISAKVAAYGQTRKDLLDSVESFKRSWTLVMGASPGDFSDPKTPESLKLQAIRGTKDTLKSAVLTEQVDPGTIEAARVMVPEYMKLESDAAKKLEMSLIYADLFRVTGDSDNAIAGYRAVLETNVDNIDALAGLGLSLVNKGYIVGDKSLLQEGANMLQKYASLAPDGHKYKVDALGLLDSLKKENVAPQKVPSGRKKN